MKRIILSALIIIVFNININAQWLQIGSDIDGEAADDYFGSSIGMSGDGAFVAIGAPYNDGNGFNSGHIRVFENLSGVWSQVGIDIVGSNTGSYGHKNTISLSDDGAVIAIGIAGDYTNGNSSGLVRILQNMGGIWSQIGSGIYGTAAYDVFGNSVALSGDGSVVAVGSAMPLGVSSVKVFQNLAGTWSRIMTTLSRLLSTSRRLNEINC